MQILNMLLDRRYLVLLLFVVCVVFEPSFPSNILAPFQTPTPDIPAPSKQIISNTLPLIEQWRWSGDADFSVAVGDRIIIIGDEEGDQRIIVFDAGTGNILWQSEPIRNVQSLTADTSRVYVGTIRYVQAFELATGQQLWRGVEQPSMKRGGLIVDIRKNQLEVYDISDPAVYRLDSATGQIVEETAKNLFSRWDNTEYAVVHGNYLLEARDATSNEKLWSYAFPGYVHGRPVFSEDMMFQNARGLIFGIKNRTGEVIWQTPDIQSTFTHPDYVSSVAVQGNRVYVLRYDAAIVGFDSEIGKQVGIMTMSPARTLEDDSGYVKYYGIATSDKFIAVYYGNSRELIVFEMNSDK